ncbi:DNA-directed RNA polymerase [Musa troglodytarum]|uniref:DNA-directed RNA polymerase n=1 Tax=Musa troglodytarum TaxID=320322 RepID=A0A9E7G931_9LILI|nr:DNA-directed RNA polymerase [Musa troglodytarum]
MKQPPASYLYHQQQQEEMEEAVAVTVGMEVDDADPIEILSDFDRQQPPVDADFFNSFDDQDLASRHLLFLLVLSWFVEPAPPATNSSGIHFRGTAAHLFRVGFSQIRRLRSFIHPLNHHFGTPTDDHATIEDDEITQDDRLSAYFEENSLMRQQLDSFDKRLNINLCLVSCGLVKNLALMVHITVGFVVHSLLKFLEELCTESFEESTKIFVNGCWVGIHRDPDFLVNILRQFRKQNDPSSELGIIQGIRLKELRLYTDSGHCSRPLFIVENQRLLIKKKDILALQQRGLVSERQNPVESYSVTYTHCDIL